jgi:hypothetical protein
LLRVYVRCLRRKLGAAGARPLIHTVRGVGYVMREPLATPPTARSPAAASRRVPPAGHSRDAPLPDYPIPSPPRWVRADSPRWVRASAASLPTRWRSP